MRPTPACSWCASPLPAFLEMRWIRKRCTSFETISHIEWAAALATVCAVTSIRPTFESCSTNASAIRAPSRVPPRAPCTRERGGGCGNML